MFALERRPSCADHDLLGVQGSVAAVMGLTCRCRRLALARAGSWPSGVVRHTTFRGADERRLPVVDDKMRPRQDETSAAAGRHRDETAASNRNDLQAFAFVRFEDAVVLGDDLRAQKRLRFPVRADPPRPSSYVTVQSRPEGSSPSRA